MKAAILALPLFVLATAPAHADVWTDYLQIECDPAVANFSVRPRFAYVEPGSPKPSTWIEVRRGVAEDGTRDNPPTRTEGSDLFASCRLEELLFEVVRTAASTPSLCSQGCITGSATFEIKLNGQILAEGQIGYEQRAVIDSVTYDGNQLYICETLNRHYRAKDAELRSSVTCRAGYVHQFLK